MHTNCERCGGRDSYVDDQGRVLLRDHVQDYCAVCSKDLCEKCMAAGCCGHKPALSGNDADDN